MMYNFLKKNGIPDERIVAGLSEFHACSAFNFYPGKLHLTENSQVINSCHSDVNIDYKESDFHNFAFVDVLKGRSSQMVNNFSKLKTDKNSRIVLIITAHGGENFIKVRGRSVVLSDELNRALNEMHIKGRYKEILFIVDTCEGFSLFDYVDAPNIYFVSSSTRDQKAHSYSFDYKQMTPTADRFHFKLLENLEAIYRRKSFKSSIDDIFISIKNQRAFLESDVSIQNKIEREILFEEFFGNPQKKGGKNEKYKYILEDHSNLESNDSYKNWQNVNSLLEEKRSKTDNEVLNIKHLHEHRYSLTSKENNLNVKLNSTSADVLTIENITTANSSPLPMNIIFVSLIIYLIYNIIKS